MVAQAQTSADHRMRLQDWQALAVELILIGKVTSDALSHGTAKRIVIAAPF